MNEITLKFKLTKFIHLFKYGFCLLLMLFGQILLAQSQGTIQIGSGTTSTGGGSLTIPVTNYNYSYSQQIVSGTEFSTANGIAGPITKLRYKPSSVGTITVWNDLKIYVANTTKTEFSTNTDWVPFSDLTLVFDGVVTPEPVAGEWFEVTFIAPFNYTGGNLIIAVHENASGWLSSPSFNTYVSTANSGIVWRQDSSNADPSTENLTATGRTNILPQLQFVGALSPCASPQDVVVNRTHNSAVATWTINSNSNLGTSYELRTSGAVGSGATGLVQEGTVPAGVNTLSFNGLLQSTAYKLYLKSNCTGLTSFWSIPYEFTTFYAVPSPWFEGFATSTVPTGFASNMSLTNATDTNPGSTGYFYRYNIYGTGSYSVANLSTVNVGPLLTGDKLSFDYSLTTYSGYQAVDPEIVSFDVQISTDYGVTFNTIATFLNDGASGWNNFEYAFPNSYIGQVVKVKIVATRNAGDSYLAFDNFYIGSCPLPSTLSVASTDVSATLNWLNYASNTYQIEYGPTGFAVGTGTVVNGVSNNHLIQGLTPNTVYQVYVKNNCGTSQSPKMGPFSFKTETLVTRVWYDLLNSNTQPAGFSTDMGYSNSATVVPGAFSYYYNTNLYSVATSTRYLSTLNVGPVAANDVFEFYYGSRNTTPGSVTVQVLVSTDFGNTFSNLSTFDFDGSNEWKIFSHPLAAYEGQNVKFKIVSTLVSGDNYIGFDNFYVGPCGIAPIPKVQQRTSSSVTLSWAGSPSQTNEIEWGPVGFAQGAGNIVQADGTSVTISGLSENTTYEYYIRRTCASDNSVIWIGKYKFKTACNPFIGGFSENFSSVTTGSETNPTIPDCWYFYDGGKGYGYVSSTALGSPKSFYIYNSTDQVNPYILVSPETQNLGNGNYHVRFNARGGSVDEQLIFGTMSNPLDASTFEPLQVFNLPTTYSSTSQEYIVYLPAGTNDFFAFKHGSVRSASAIYIDDVVYEENAACPVPGTFIVDKNLPALTALLEWNGPANIVDNNFEIEWGPAGFTLGQGTLTTSSTFEKEIPGLTLGQSYSFYVRRVCGGGSSVWIGPKTIDMGYCVPTQPNSFSVDNSGITNVQIDNVSVNPVSTVMYNNYTDQVLSFQGGQDVTASLTSGTGYTYDTHIWIDLNQNGIFEINEIVFSGVASNENPSTLDMSFTIPDNGEYLTGEYRIRVASADSAQSYPSPCHSGSYSYIFDFKATIDYPCVQPSNISFVDVGYDYAVIDWEGLGGSVFEIEFGPTGFVRGTGTTILNAAKPYRVEDLTPGSTYDFYVRKKCGNLYSEWSVVGTTYVFCDTPEPTGASNQTLVQDETLAQLIINGVNLKFYSDPALTIEVPVTTALQSSGVFYVTQTINCESDSYLIIDVNVLPRIAKPIVPSGQNFCDSGTIGDIPVTSVSGATVIWYATETSTTPLPLNTPLVTGNYYVVQTDGVTTSHRVMVPVVINTTPPNLVSQTISLCGSYTFGNLSINNLAGTTVKWYVSQTATTPIGNNVPVVTGTYYVTQSFGTCESQRVPFQITQNESLNKPIAGAQNFCGSGTVANLVAQGAAGAQILWYSSATSTNALSPSTQLSNGTYYVAQTMNGCSSEKRAVAVRVISIAAPQISAFTVCGGGTISDLYISTSAETSYKWYLSPSSDFELAQTTPLVQGTYYVERVQYGCVSARAMVQVNIGAVPNPPTGVASQSYVEGSTIANLVLNQLNVVWYASINDSQNGVNPLPSYTPLVNGTTYYAVIIGSNGCPSYPFAVTVQVYLSNDEFDKEGLKYYPNPVNDVLNINYVESIRSVEVFDLLGKRVKALNTNEQNIQIDLSDLASGTYMIQLKTDTKTQFIKVIKK